MLSCGIESDDKQLAATHCIGKGGEVGVGLLNHPFGLQQILHTALAIHIKSPTVCKWTTSLTAIENHRCLQTSLVAAMQPICSRKSSR